MRLPETKIQALKNKGYLPVLEWCRKNNIAYSDHIKDLITRNLIPCLLIENTFKFIPAHYKWNGIGQGGSDKRGKIQGDENVQNIKLTEILTAPEAEEIKPKSKRGRPAKAKE